MDDNFGKQLNESENQNKMPNKRAIYRRTDGLREVYRRMQAAKSAGNSNLIFQKLQHVT